MKAPIKTTEGITKLLKGKPTLKCPKLRLSTWDYFSYRAISVRLWSDWLFYFSTTLAYTDLAHQLMTSLANIYFKFSEKIKNCDRVSETKFYEMYIIYLIGSYMDQLWGSNRFLFYLNACIKHSNSLRKIIGHKYSGIKWCVKFSSRGWIPLSVK